MTMHHVLFPILHALSGQQKNVAAQTILLLGKYAANLALNLQEHSKCAT
jgi:hypothetical protein